MNRLRADGFEVADEDVARLLPLLHEHINMLGRYSFSEPEGGGHRRVATVAQVDG